MKFFWPVSEQKVFIQDTIGYYYPSYLDVVGDHGNPPDPDPQSPERGAGVRPVGVADAPGQDLVAHDHHAGGGLRILLRRANGQICSRGKRGNLDIIGLYS